MAYILGYSSENWHSLCRLIETRDDIVGIIFFKRNISSLDELAKRIEHLRFLRDDLIMSCDFEGGKVNRLSHLGYRVESASIVGKHYSSSPSCQKSALYRLRNQLIPVAKAFSQVGMNTVFGPCIDRHGISPIITGCQRSYSDNFEVIEAFARVFIDVFESFGLDCVIKHFPSHAMATGDTHVQCAQDRRTKAQLVEDIDLYHRLLEDYSRLGVMLSHCIFPNIDSRPASLSSFWLDHFSYLPSHRIYTDCLDMSAVDRYLNIGALSNNSIRKIFSTLDGNLVSKAILSVEF